MVAPKIRWNESTKRRYCEPPCCIPNTSSISAALSNLILGVRCRTAIVAKKIATVLSPGEAVARVSRHLEDELPVPAFVKNATLSWPFHREPAKDKRPRSKAQILCFAIPLFPNQLNRCGLAEFLF
jgi:hypothetical protein